VNGYEEKAPYTKVAQPWPDHFYPLHVALGAAWDGCRAELIHHSFVQVHHEHLMGFCCRRRSVELGPVIHER
jgi:hypothetical protein